MEINVRKISKALLYPPGDDRLDARPRGISGATITSWDGPPEVDLDALFAKPGDHVSLAGGGSEPVPTARRAPRETVKVEPVTFTTADRFMIIAID